MRKIPAVDLMLFWGIIGTIGVAHSLLLTSGTPWETTTWFYIIMWLASMVILLYCRLLYKEEGQFDYDEDLSHSKLGYVVAGVITTIVCSSVLIRAYTSNSIWVPQPNMTLGIGTMSLSAVVNDLLYQLALVANSEETMVLSLSQVVRKKLIHSNINSRIIVPAAIIIPRIGWGSLHAYVSYVGELQLILVVSAIVSGCIISYCAYNKQVRAFLAAVLIHFGFNASVVLAKALGLM